MNLRRTAVCFYGTSNKNTLSIREYLDKSFSDLNYFEHYDDDVYKSLWISNFKKRQVELALKQDFSSCLAIDTSDDTLELILNNTDLLSKINSCTDNKIYFVNGEFFLNKGSTSASPQIFFSNSFTFDLACNFGLQRSTLPLDRKLGTIGEDFYYFLKTLKIKTQCINYENRNLFKRTA
jgi:hypothetical protein